jgi:hypothetical protein
VRLALQARYPVETDDSTLVEHVETFEGWARRKSGT